MKYKNYEYFFLNQFLFYSGFVPRPTRLDFDQGNDVSNSGLDELSPPPSQQTNSSYPSQQTNSSYPSQQTNSSYSSNQPSYHVPEKRQAPPPPVKQQQDFNTTNKNKVQVRTKTPNKNKYPVRIKKKQGYKV